MWDDIVVLIVTSLSLTVNPVNPLSPGSTHVTSKLVSVLSLSCMDSTDKGPVEAEIFKIQYCYLCKSQNIQIMQK